MHDIYSSKAINQTEEIISAASSLLQIGHPIEVRVKSNKGIKTGYFNNPDSLATSILPYLPNKDIEAIWVLLNPAPVDFLQRVTNTIALLPHSVQDVDVPILCWLLVDFDPVRFGADGKPLKTNKISATPEERNKAIELAERVRIDLAGQGWPEPIVLCSGNGVQMWYFIGRVENTEANRLLLGRVLASLSLKYSTSDVDIDESTFNPSRLGRLPGTVNRKGPNTPDRPHCWSYLISKPDFLQPVPSELLQEMASSLPIEAYADAPSDSETTKPMAKSWISDWISTHNLPVIKQGAWKDKGYRWILAECPFGGLHMNATAFIVRQRNGAVAAGCLHSDCKGKSWYDLRDIVEPGWRERAQSAKKNGCAPESNLASRLVRSVERMVDLFRGSDGKSYAAVEEGDRRELYEVGSQAFKHWLTRFCRGELRSIPTAEALSNAINALTATAQGNPTEEVHHRVANLGTAIYIDIGDNQRTAIEVTETGWQVISKPPVYFRRSHTTDALPMPMRGGNIGELKRFLNYGSEDNFILSVSWVLAALRGAKPYPILIVTGPHGSAKSTYAEVLRKLVDPATQLNLRSVPKDERDLAIAGCNNYALAFTNVSYLSPSMSDAFCRMAKGEGFGTRALHTNGDEALFGYANPVCLDGIEDFAERPDLLDRAVLVSVPPITEEQRREEISFWLEFEEGRPRILGALLDALSAGMHNLCHTKLNKLPRMADFARWISACEPALSWGQGRFMAAYGGSHEAADDIAFNSSVVAQAVHEWFTGKTEWEGTATELLSEFGAGQYDKYTKSKAWPKSPNAFTGKLRRDIHTLGSRGIQVVFPEGRKGKNRKRCICITKAQAEAEGQERPMVTDVTDLFPSFNGRGGREHSSTPYATQDTTEGEEAKNIGHIGLSVTHPRLIGPIECSFEELERQATQSDTIKLSSAT
jgi:hypothetical protein